MFKCTTSVGRAIIAKTLFEKGLNTGIPLEKAELAFKASSLLNPEIEAFQSAVKAKVSEYNVRLADYKKDTGKDELSSELITERDGLNDEIEKQKERIFSIIFSDDKYRAFLDVVESAKKVWYKAIQDKNGCEDQEKAKKIVAPTGNEFTEFSEFIDDLNGAEKEKTK